MSRLNWTKGLTSHTPIVAAALTPISEIKKKVQQPGTNFRITDEHWAGGNN